MKIGIYAAGNAVMNFDRNIPYIGVDGGLEFLLKTGITPRYAIGDFDSYDGAPDFANVIRLPARKDVTDTHAALLKALELGYDEIVIYGVTGGRLDHFFAVMRLLYRYKDENITVLDDDNRITILNPGCHIIKKDGYRYVSFFAVEPCRISLEGFSYPLKDYLLAYDDPLCVSNEILKDHAAVTTDHSVYMIESRDR